jgi:hypothetical protein
MSHFWMRAIHWKRTMNQLGWIALVVANIPVYFGLGWLFFGDWDEFLESLWFWITPDIISLFRGEWEQDWWAEIRFWFWIGCCAACVFGEGWLMEQII